MCQDLPNSYYLTDNTYEKPGKLERHQLHKQLCWICGMKNVRYQHDTHPLYKRPPSPSLPRANGSRLCQKDTFSRRHCTCCKGRGSDGPSTVQSLLTFLVPHQQTPATVLPHICLQKFPLVSFCYLQRPLRKRDPCQIIFSCISRAGRIPHPFSLVFTTFTWNLRPS
jgi:hypothetical protein